MDEFENETLGLSLMANSNAMKQSLLLNKYYKD